MLLDAARILAGKCFVYRKTARKFFLVRFEDF
jgi:hypothetical protein